MEYLLLLLMTIGYILLSVKGQTFQRNQKCIESKLDILIKYFDLVDSTSELITDKLKDELVKEIEAGDHVKAVKRLREVTGMDLIDAKHYIDNL